MQYKIPPWSSSVHRCRHTFLSSSLFPPPSSSKALSATAAMEGGKFRKKRAEQWRYSAPPPPLFSHGNNPLRPVTIDVKGWREGGSTRGIFPLLNSWMNPRQCLCCGCCGVAVDSSTRTAVGMKIYLHQTRLKSLEGGLHIFFRGIQKISSFFFSRSFFGGRTPAEREKTRMQCFG